MDLRGPILQKMQPPRPTITAREALHKAGRPLLMRVSRVSVMSRVLSFTRSTRPLRYIHLCLCGWKGKQGSFSCYDYWKCELWPNRVANCLFYLLQRPPVMCRWLKTSEDPYVWETTAVLQTLVSSRFYQFYPDQQLPKNQIYSNLSFPINRHC